MSSSSGRAGYENNKISRPKRIFVDNVEREPLPAVKRGDPSGEFVTRSHYETLFESFHRKNIDPLLKVTGEVFSMVASKENVYIVTGVGLVLCSIGAIEAALCMKPHIHAFSNEGLHFIWSYSTGQILPSFIWKYVRLITINLSHDC